MLKVSIFDPENLMSFKSCCEIEVTIVILSLLTHVTISFDKYKLVLYVRWQMNNYMFS